MLQYFYNAGGRRASARTDAVGGRGSEATARNTMGGASPPVTRRGSGGTKRADCCGWGVSEERSDDFT